MKNSFDHEDKLVQEIRTRLRAAGESVWQRYPLPWPLPSFKSCPTAARNLFSLLQDATVYLVMRDPCLRPVREAVVNQGKRLVWPSRHADTLLSIHRPVIQSSNDCQKGVLRIDPPPGDALPFKGAVDAVIVACLAFNRYRRRPYTFELEKTAYALDRMREGLSNGWRLPQGVPVVLVAADQQEVDCWPESAQGFVEADLVVTPTRVIMLGSGEEVPVLKDPLPDLRIGM